MNKKEKLAQVLIDEFNRLKENPNFDKLAKEEDYTLAIEYLNTGEYPRYYNDFDLLYACIEDFEQMCNDYDIN